MRMLASGRAGVVDEQNLRRGFPVVVAVGNATQFVAVPQESIGLIDEQRGPRRMNNASRPRAHENQSPKNKLSKVALFHA